jgi:hypothetical protein
MPTKKKARTIKGKGKAAKRNPNIKRGKEDKKK